MARLRQSLFGSTVGAPRKGTAPAPANTRLLLVREPARAPVRHVARAPPGPARTRYVRADRVAAAGGPAYDAAALQAGAQLQLMLCWSKSLKITLRLSLTVPAERVCRRYLSPAA